MADISNEADSVYRDREAPGSSVRHEPVKSEIRTLFRTVEGAIQSVADFAAAGVKWSTASVRVRSTANVDIATALENGDTLNGVTLATGDIVFLPYQTAPAENGFYTVPASGAAARSTFADTAAELAYIGVLILAGTSGAGERWTLNKAAADITVGSTALNFSLIGVEVSYATEVLESRGGFDSLGDRLDDMDTKIDAEENAEAAIGRAALYGISDPVEARLFAQQSREMDFTAGYYRDGFEALSGLGGVAGWTFSRPSAAWAEQDGGPLLAFAADEPRITNRGLLLEGLSTQGLPYSSAFGSVSSSNVTLTAANPDYAGASAMNIQATATAATQIVLDSSGIATASPGTVVWAAVAKGTGALVANDFAVVNLTTSTALVIGSINYDTGAVEVTTGDPADVQVYPQDAGWFVLAITPSTGVNNGDALRFYPGFIGAPATAGDYFRMSHAQIENEPFPTSRIINNTGAAADRAADSAFVEFSAAGDFTVFAEATLGAHAREEAIFSIDDGSNDNRITVSRLANGAIRLLTAKAGVTASVDVAGKSGPRTVRVAVASFGSLSLLCVDGNVAATVNQTRPDGLDRAWLGRTSAGLPMDGTIARYLVVDQAFSEANLQAMTAPDGVAALASAPTVGNPLQGRFNPLTGTTPDGLYGRSPVVVYGELPCALLICEMFGPSALAIGRDGTVMFRDTLHLGRWIDVDPQTGLCLVGDGTYRTVRWLNSSGIVVHSWSVDSGIDGEIYGLRTNGDTLVINMVDGADGSTWTWSLDADGFPTGAATAFGAFTGTGKQARGMLIDGPTLWIASMEDPINPQGCRGALQAYTLATGSLVDSYYGHFPNDVDRLPSGEIVWVDEHLDRIRGVVQSTDTVRSIMAGLQICFDYEPAVSSISANVLARATMDGSGLEASAVEYRGINGLYAPNGLTVIADGLFAIADTDNGRVIIARETDTWEPEVVAVVAMLNAPTKVRIIPAA